MEQKGVLYDFIQSEDEDSVERLTAMLCQNGYRTIVIVGGDRAVNDAINAIMKNKAVLVEGFAIGVIPNGIANDFARFWGIEVDTYKRSVENIIARHTRKIDIGVCKYMDDTIPQTRYFVNCINIGLGARLVKISNDALRLIGSKRLSFIPVFLSQVFERKSFKMALRIDTEQLQGEYMSICIGNCLGYGQTPNAVPYNGALDISVITRPKWWQMFEGFWLLGKGRFLNYKNVHPYRASTVVVEDCGKAIVSCDSKALNGKASEPIKATVLKEEIDFIIQPY
jgi:diacylglycerol kinase family enzyme